MGKFITPLEERKDFQEFLLKRCPFCDSKLGILAYRKRKAQKDCVCSACKRTIRPQRDSQKDPAPWPPVQHMQ